MNESAPDIYNENCPTRIVLDRIADKWTVLIIGQLAEGTLRFNELKRCIGGITQKMLTQTLKSLERDGMISRTIYPEIPPKVEYSLTELGKSLTMVVRQIRTWSEDNFTKILEAQNRKP
jgi:DNA-binding HxlR family transcriptional regulator